MREVPTAPPIEDHVLTLPNGRRVAWAEWGRVSAPSVLLLHRSPGSRLFDPDPAATAAAGIRLLTVDRPGYGGTDPVTDPRRAAVAADVAALADAQDLDELALLGWSGGGQFAIELAGTLGSRVRSVSLLATPALDEEVPWLAEEFRQMLRGLADDPVGAAVAIARAGQWFADNPDAVVTADPSPADAQVRGRPGVTEALTIMMREGARQGATGLAFDAVAGSRRDPFPFAEITCPVHLWYGDADPIGPEHGRWYAGHLRETTMTLLPDAGHLLPITHWATILDRALS